MQTAPIIFRIESGANDADTADALRRAAEVLRRGGLVAFPTETVYGLGANALDPAAVARIFAAKGRPANNPLIVHVTRTEQARELAADLARQCRTIGGEVLARAADAGSAASAARAGYRHRRRGDGGLAQSSASNRSGTAGSGQPADRGSERKSQQSNFADDGRTCFARIGRGGRYSVGRRAGERRAGIDGIGPLDQSTPLASPRLGAAKPDRGSDRPDRMP